MWKHFVEKLGNIYAYVILRKSESPNIIYIILSKVIGKLERIFNKMIVKGQRGLADTHRLVNPIDN